MSINNSQPVKPFILEDGSSLPSSSPNKNKRKADQIDDKTSKLVTNLKSNTTEAAEPISKKRVVDLNASKPAATTTTASETSTAVVPSVQPISMEKFFYLNPLFDLIFNYVANKDEVLAFNPELDTNTAIQATASSNHVENQTHDVELQYRLQARLLKENPKYQSIFSGQVGNQEQILLSRKNIYLAQYPEYTLAIKKWERHGLTLEKQVMRLQFLNSYVFGRDKWNESYGLIDRVIPALSEDIFEILFSADPNKLNENRVDNSVLTLIPTLVEKDGEYSSISIAEGWFEGDTAKFSRIDCRGRNDSYWSCIPKAKLKPKEIAQNITPRDILNYLWDDRIYPDNSIVNIFHKTIILAENCLMTTVRAIYEHTWNEGACYSPVTSICNSILLILWR